MDERKGGTKEGKEWGKRRLEGKKRDEGRDGMRKEKVWTKRRDEGKGGMRVVGGGQTNEGEWGLKKGRRWSLSANKPVWYNMSDITSDK